VPCSRAGSGHVHGVGRAVLAAVAAWGAAITAFGLVTVSFPIALLCLAIAGAADMFSAIFRSTIVQLDTPDNVRGRVMSIHILVVTSGPRIGDIEAAVVAALTTPQFAVVSGACCACSASPRSRAGSPSSPVTSSVARRPPGLPRRRRLGRRGRDLAGGPG
jgi:hypothetical protein